LLLFAHEDFSELVFQSFIFQNVVYIDVLERQYH